MGACVGVSDGLCVVGLDDGAYVGGLDDGLYVGCLEVGGFVLCCVSLSCGGHCAGRGVGGQLLR